MEERDDVSLISVVSSVGEEDSYLSEPTYNNLDPVWAQRHGFGPGEDMILRSRATNKGSRRFYNHEEGSYNVYKGPSSPG